MQAIIPISARVMPSAGEPRAKATPVAGRTLGRPARAQSAGRGSRGGLGMDHDVGEVGTIATDIFFELACGAVRLG